MMTAAYVGGGQALTVSFGLTCVAVLLWRAVDGLQGAVRDIAGGIFVAAYVPFLASFSILMLAAPETGPGASSSSSSSPCAATSAATRWAWSPAGTPWRPSVSPKKSWEGFAGSVAACVLGGALSVALALHGPWWAGALVGLAAAVTATVGDLTESTVKRDLGIKDMGSILPGHGGLMDRLDSLLLVGPDGVGAADRVCPFLLTAETMGRCLPPTPPLQRRP